MSTGLAFSDAMRSETAMAATMAVEPLDEYTLDGSVYEMVALVSSCCSTAHRSMITRLRGRVSINTTGCSGGNLATRQVLCRGSPRMCPQRRVALGSEWLSVG